MLGQPCDPAHAERIVAAHEHRQRGRRRIGPLERGAQRRADVLQPARRLDHRSESDTDDSDIAPMVRCARRIGTEQPAWKPAASTTPSSGREKRCDASKSSSWNARPRAASTKAEHVLTGAPYRLPAASPRCSRRSRSTPPAGRCGRSRHDRWRRTRARDPLPRPAAAPPIPAPRRRPSRAARSQRPRAERTRPRHQRASAPTPRAPPRRRPRPSSRPRRPSARGSQRSSRPHRRC